MASSMAEKEGEFNNLCESTKQCSVWIYRTLLGTWINISLGSLINNRYLNFTSNGSSSTGPGVVEEVEEAEEGGKKVLVLGADEDIGEAKA